MRKRNQNANRKGKQKNANSPPPQTANNNDTKQTSDNFPLENDESFFPPKLKFLLFEYACFFSIMFIALLFVGVFRFNEPTFYYDSNDETPFALIMDEMIDNVPQRLVLKNLCLLFIGTLLYIFLRYHHCDLDLSTIFPLSALLDAGFSTFACFSFSNFIHTSLILIIIILFTILLHQKAFTTRWYALSATVTFLISVDFCFRVESVVFYFVELTMIAISVRKTNSMFFPRKPTKLFNIMILVLINLPVLLIVLCSIHYFVGLPRCKMIFISPSDVYDEYYLSQYNYSLLALEVLSIALFKFAYLSSYNLRMIYILLLSLILIIVFPLYSGESALMIKLFECKLMLLLAAGIVLGRQSRLYGSFASILACTITAWIGRYNFRALDFD